MATPVEEALGAVEEPSINQQARPPGEEAEAEKKPAASIQWAAIVEKIRAGDPGGMEELYRTFSRGIRYFIYKHIGPGELDDRVHDAFLIVVQAIRNGSLREPERLMGFVRTVVRRQVAASIDAAVHQRQEFTDLEVGGLVADCRQDPEEMAMGQERMRLIIRVLSDIPDRDREILTRFYLREQSQEQICEEMSLTETQFRLIKSRAKAKFGEIGRKKMEPSPVRALFVRKAAGG